VRTAQHIYPAAELSEQISTAGMEASGTGNMKLALNGALTIGTLDGANLEIRERVGAENFFLFGHTADQVARRRAAGYNPWDMIRANELLQDTVEFIASGALTDGDVDLFRPWIEELCRRDHFFTIADFGSYQQAQEAVSSAYASPERWTRMSILSVARMGHFSADRAIREYASEIWKVSPLTVRMNGQRLA
jgi:starch phosphorylase